MDNKYIINYIEKNMIGGTLDIYKKDLTHTASYIYSIHPRTKVYYFALTRKVPFGSRIRLNGNPNTGAAGTNKKFHGKWGSFGGSIGKNTGKRSNLYNAISELNDEGGLNFNSRNDVDTDINKNSSKKILQLKAYKKNKSLGLFIFKYNNFQNFIKMFPIFPKKRGGSSLVNTSHGEIDFVSSFTMKQIINQQNKELKLKNNNFMLSYAIKSFNNYVLPNMSFIFQNKWKNKLKSIIDTKPRHFNNIPKYIEQKNGKYI